MREEGGKMMHPRASYEYHHHHQQQQSQQPQPEGNKGRQGGANCHKNSMNASGYGGPEKEEEVANFLLTLKNRSVSPEPPHLVISSSCSGEDSANGSYHHRYGHPHHNHHHHHHHQNPPHHQHHAATSCPSSRQQYSSYHYPAPYGGYSSMERGGPPPYPGQHHHHQQAAPPPPPMSHHQHHNNHNHAMTTGGGVPSTSCGGIVEDGTFVWESLLSNSPLVFMKDRDLVPDALFVAMAQMKPCRLTMADRVGCYKSRELGFVGMSCKHCGGQPGFGRYYPNSVRSLAQTTTSQTILKHIGSKCRFCPPQIRNAVNELQRQQAARENAASSGGSSAAGSTGSGGNSARPRYGSRKIFFQRIWSRLHGESTKEKPPADHHGDDDSTAKLTVDDSSHQTPSDVDESSLGTSGSSDLLADHHLQVETSSSSKKRHGRNGFGSLPMNGKRVKVTSPHHRLSAD